MMGAVQSTCVPPFYPPKLKRRTKGLTVFVRVQCARFCAVWQHRCRQTLCFGVQHVQCSQLLAGYHLLAAKSRQQQHSPTSTGKSVARDLASHPTHKHARRGHRSAGAQQQPARRQRRGGGGSGG